MAPLAVAVEIGQSGVLEAAQVWPRQQSETDPRQFSAFGLELDALLDLIHGSDALDAMHELDDSAETLTETKTRTGQWRCINCGRPLAPEDREVMTVQPITLKARWHTRIATCSDACTAAVMRRRAAARERRRPKLPPNTRPRRLLDWLLEHHLKYS